MNPNNEAGFKREGRGVHEGDGLFPTCFSSRLRALRVKPSGSNGQSGFALIITVLLLGLLVLVIYGLSALGRVGTDISASGTYQTQARQHALLGLAQATGALQHYAVADDVLTGMAGIAGMPEGANQPARQWCGVWDSSGQFRHWLASGGSGAAVPVLTGSDAIALTASGTLGADGVDREHVAVLMLPVIMPTRDRAAVLFGHYAWWVGDEGVKLSLVLPAEKHGIDELVTLPPDAPLLANVLSYEQASWIPTTVSQAVLAGQLRTNFHSLGRTHLGWAGAVQVPGSLNVNSSTARYWRGVAATYNRHKAATAPALAPAAFGTWMRDHITLADPTIGKAANAPYASVALFLNSAALAGALGNDSELLAAFSETMRPWLAVRSDTFRVRAYGDAVNPSDTIKMESTACCEAILQRIKDDPGSAEGRFVVTYFRWLGPDDI